MEFPFYISKVLSPDEEGFVILDAASMNQKSGTKNTPAYINTYGQTKLDPSRDYLVSILDQMGEASSKVSSYEYAYN
jgi:hypothetical protein